MTEEFTDRRLMGVRTFRVGEVDGDTRLFSTSIKNDPSHWPVGKVKKAECASSRQCDSSPNPEHSCGLHGYYNFDLLTKYMPLAMAQRVRNVYGVISVWGDPFIMYEYGFRAQYGEVEALLMDQTHIPIVGTEISIVDAYLDLSNALGLPLLTPDELEDFAEEKGLAYIYQQKPPRPEEDPDKIVIVGIDWAHPADVMAARNVKRMRDGELGVPYVQPKSGYELERPTDFIGRAFADDVIQDGDPVKLDRNGHIIKGEEAGGYVYSAIVRRLGGDND